MKFSLIIGTLNRPAAIVSCIDSINKQVYSDYEIIIVDQSENDLTENYIKTLNNEKIKYYHVDFTGLSKARNYALRNAKGEYFCLLDDDAYYDEMYLQTANSYLEENVILSGYIYDTVKKKDFVSYNQRNDKRIVSLRTIMRLCPSAGLVFPMKIFNEIGDFDEKFGVGGTYGSGEETDYILRSLSYGYHVKYIADMRLKHPVPKPLLNISNKEIDDKEIKYFEGLGALYGKHLYQRHIRKLFFCLLEVKLKLFIKGLLPFMYRRDVIVKKKNALKNGIKAFL